MLCFGLISCCTTQLWLCLRTQTDGQTFFYRLFSKKAEFRIPSVVRSYSGPEEANWSDTIILSLSDGIMLFFLKLNFNKNYFWNHEHSLEMRQVKLTEHYLLLLPVLWWPTGCVVDALTVHFIDRQLLTRSITVSMFLHSHNIYSLFC